MKEPRIYKTAADAFGVVDTGVKVYICPKFLDDFAEELRKQAAERAATENRTTTPTTQREVKQ